MRTIAVLLTTALLAFGAARAAEPVRVMVVGMIHLANPSQDKMNVAVDDVLSDKRQAELAAIGEALLRFEPTLVAVEWPADVTAAHYAEYLAGTLQPSRNEVVQIGYRLAKAAGLKTVYGIDVEGEFPFDAVTAYAEAHGQKALIDDAMATIEAAVAGMQTAVNGGTLGRALRYVNEPTRIVADNAFYRALLRVGGGDEQPAALLLAAWQKRNAVICAKLIQLAKPGDRVTLFFGSGHGMLLRQCVAETPGFELIEANDFLPN